MSRQLDKAEFKDFIIRNRKETIVWRAVFFLAFLIYTCVFILIEGTLKLNRGLEKLDYEYIILSDESAGSNTYIKYTNLATVKMGETSINVNTYMQDEGGVYRKGSPMYSEKLAANEIIVSEKVAKELKLDVGSIVKLEFILSERDTVYVVKGIMEYITDYYKFEENSDFSVVLIGYSEDMIQKNRNQYVSFFNENELRGYQESNHLYKDMIYIDAERDTVKNKSICMEILLIGLHVLIFGIYTISIRTVTMREMKKYYYDGFSLWSIYYFIRTYRRMIILIPWMISLFWMLIIGKETLTWEIWMIGFFVEIILYSLFWIRNSAYGKADRI